MSSVRSKPESSSCLFADGIGFENHGRCCRECLRIEES